MCHDHFTRSRAWEDRVEREMDDEDEEATDMEDQEPIPPLQADDEPDDDLDVLTDGGAE